MQTAPKALCNLAVPRVTRYSQCATRTTCSHPREPRRAEVQGEQQEFILQALRGGVLEVRVRHPPRGIRAGGQLAAPAR